MSKKFVKRLDGWGTGKKYLDEGVRPLVLLLNSKGFRTWASCEGGKGHDYPAGWITFYEDIQPFSKEEVRELKDIVESYTSIPFKILYRGGLTSINFSKPLVSYPDSDYINPGCKEFWNPEDIELTKWVEGSRGPLNKKDIEL